MKELERINWKIVQKIVRFLRYSEKTKKTAIALNCNMSYNRCVQYIDWMKKMELVEQEYDGRGLELIHISDRGMKICED